MKRVGLLAALLLTGAACAVLVVFWQSDDAVSRESILELAASRGPMLDESALSARHISAEDLPPAGTRSLFDHLIAGNGGLPFPFENMLVMLAGYDREGRVPNSLMIPDGRSLLKGFADFAQPRVVISADMRPPVGGAELPPDFRGRLFLGFVEKAHEIEVISYNEGAGRFEFQLVENYCPDCVPRIVYAQRAICLTCHAGAAPIFPVRPWQETNVNPAIHQTIVEQVQAAAYKGLPVERRLENAEAFDNLTDVGNVIPTTQRIWLDGCGEAEQGSECRRLLLGLALAWATRPSGFDATSPAVARLRELQARAWPPAGIALASGDLSNRDPLQSELYSQSLFDRLRALLSAPKAQVLSGDKLTDFDALPPLPAEFDPITPRTAKKLIAADDLDGVYGVAQMFTPEDIERLDEVSDYSADRLATAVQTLPDELFEPAPLTRLKMMQGLLAALGETVPGYCCASTEAMSPPIAQGEPPLELADGSPLQPFRDYCFACHRGNPAAHLDFMSGASEAEVLNKIAEKSEIRDALDYERYLGSRKAAQLMPPTDSVQRRRLEEALARGEDVLSAMSAQVPSLFDF